jgi:imidazolonepropionase-like amidohydrolase
MFRDHPDAAAGRMRWACRLAAQVHTRVPGSRTRGHASRRTQRHERVFGGAQLRDVCGAGRRSAINVMASGGFATPGTDQLGAQFTITELTTLVDQAHDADLPVVAHAHSLVGIRNALAAGVDGIEHFSGLTAEGPRIDDDLLDDVARRGVYVDLTMGNDRSFHALMPAPPPPLAELMARLGVTSFDAFYMSRIGMFSRLREHGVAVVTGVDSGMGPPKRHGNAWRTVGELVEGGYSVAEALAAATSLAATACGLAGETGRLAAGYAADLLVVDGDVARDPSTLSSPQQVLVRGPPVDLVPEAVSEPPG